ncbi:TPA: hypothetical protein RZJ41_001698, partial [Campylobacter coli]|nr:hypothetical protein [Campylobacter coli]
MDYGANGIYIPEYNKTTYEIFDKNYFLYKQYVIFSSKVLTALMIFKFIRENRYLDGISLFEKVFCLKLKDWRNNLLYFNDKYLDKAISLTIKRFCAMSNDPVIDLELIIDFMSDIAYMNIKKTNLIMFYEKYGTAKLRIQNHLSYKLGKVLTINSKSIFGVLLMPIYLISTLIVDRQERKIYQEELKKNSSLAAPNLKDYPDYCDAIKIKNYFSYKLGQAL